MSKENGDETKYSTLDIRIAKKDTSFKFGNDLDYFLGYNYTGAWTYNRTVKKRLQKLLELLKKDFTAKNCRLQ